MNQWYQHCFYEQAREIRDLDRATADHILEIEGVDINTASMDECKEAIVRWQYLDEGSNGKWKVDRWKLFIALCAIRLKG